MQINEKYDLRQLKNIGIFVNKESWIRIIYYWIKVIGEKIFRKYLISAEIKGKFDDWKT